MVIIWYFLSKIVDSWCNMERLCKMGDLRTVFFKHLATKKLCISKTF